MIRSSFFSPTPLMYHPETGEPCHTFHLYDPADTPLDWMTPDGYLLRPAAPKTARTLSKILSKLPSPTTKEKLP